MDKGKYTMSALKQKYNNFHGPECVIQVGGKKLESKQISIQNLEVELCADGSAGGCHFTVSAEYNREKSQWLDDLAKTIEVGAKLEIQGGYVKKEPIFFGYVDEFTLDYSGRRPPNISVTGVDGFGFLMNCQEPIYGGQKKAKQMVEEILKKAKDAGVARSVTVGALDSFDVPPIKEQLDDFKYLRLLAERYCKSLLCVNGELIFDDVITNTEPIITLSALEDLLELSKRMSLRGQVGEVVVWGRDVNQKFIQGAANSVTIKGPGKSATQAAAKFAKAVRREFCEYARTAEECKKLAQARFNSLAMDYVSGEGVCLGLPELIPGRYVTIESLDGSTEGSYFINKVRHTFTNRNGYKTAFEFKGAKN